MYSALSDFIKAIPHPSGWDTFPPERSHEGWEVMPPLLWIFSCMFSHAIICVHYEKEGGQSEHLYTSWGLRSSTGLCSCRTDAFTYTCVPTPYTFLNICYSIDSLVHTRRLEQKPWIDKMVSLICDWLGRVQRHCTLGQRYSEWAIWPKSVCKVKQLCKFVSNVLYFAFMLLCQLNRLYVTICST